MSNSKFKQTPIQALEELNNLLTCEYSRGKRKININRVWEIVDNGLLVDYPVDTTTHQQVIYSDNKSEDSTATRFPNSGVIG